MTEQEIVDCLKENKTKGVAFGFMPEEVKKWCSDNDSNLVYYSVNGSWLSGDNRSIFDCNEIVAFPDMYELPIPKDKSGWEEFEIDQRGNFHCFKDGDMHYFFWANWNIFLKAFSDEYTAFGGWQYEEDGEWFTSPQMATEGSYTTMVTCDEHCKPAIPVKIRFWRER